MNEYIRRIDDCANFLTDFFGSIPATAIILGSGLGNLANELTDVKSIAYKDIPGFPVSSVEGHSGILSCGRLDGSPVMVMQGRFHFYEGYDMKTVTFPIRVMSRTGIRHLFLSNAAGGMNPSFAVGDIMVITDHINLFPEHPLRGRNLDSFGTRFPDMSETYSPRLVEKAFDIASEAGISLKRGVYVGGQGPTYETPAEYRFFRIIGGDAVGMSTVPEVIVARHCGMEVFALSVITDLGVEGIVNKCSHEEVQRAAAAAEPCMSHIIKRLADYCNRN